MRHLCCEGWRGIRLLGTSMLLAGLVIQPADVLAQQAEGSFQRSLTVTGPAEIEVVTGSGRIEVRPGAAGRVEITGHIRANEGWGWIGRGRWSPQERVRRIEANPPIEQIGNSIRLGRLEDEELQRNVSISYTLTVPADSSLRSKTGSGSQRLEGVRGLVEASSGSGSIAVRDVGGTLRASTGSGSIAADGVAGGLHATSGSGSIRAAGVNGPIRAKTGSGSIDVTQTGAGDVDASSGSGRVRLQGIRGAIRASTGSGGLEVQGDPTGDWRLSTASGTVRISLAAGKGVELDARTRSGRIDLGFPIAATASHDRREVRGSVRGGGALLHVRTASGGIEIR